MESTFHATTILAVRREDRAVLAGDGQVTLGNTVVKQGARKIRRLYNDNILAGFAGSAADSFALFARFEAKLEQYRGNLERSAVELAKDWRTDRALRRLEAMLIVLDKRSMFLLSGTGDLIEPDDGIVGSALGLDGCDHVAGVAVHDIPNVLLEGWHVEHFAVGRHGHAVAPLGQRFFPERFFAGQVQAVELFGCREIEPAIRGAGAYALDVVRHGLRTMRSLDTLDELVAAIDFENEDASAAEFEIIANPRRGDVEVAAVR